MDSVGQAAAATTVTAVVTESAVCNACKRSLDEAQDESVVSFGKYLFHVDCRCAKCNSLVEHNTNLLLLSDGSPVCENCSYMCTICQKPIHNEAIVTGDESYHADCFRCRSCSNKIEELIFAKTNQGIWCMSCHNDRVARTRRHAEAKRRAKKDRDSKVTKSASGRSDGEPRPDGKNEAITSEQVLAPFDSLQSPGPSPNPAQSPRSRTPSAVRPLPAQPNGQSSTEDLGRALTPATSASSRTLATDARTSPLPSASSSSSALSPSENGASPLRPRTPTIASPPPRSHGLGSTAADVFGDGSGSEERSLSGDAGLASGLSAPAANSKANNRRSGFYGTLARPVPPIQDPASPSDRRSSVIPADQPAGSPRRPSHDVSTPPRALGSSLPLAAPNVSASTEDDLQRPAARLDQDALLFLTHVNSASPLQPTPLRVDADVPGDALTSDEERLDSSALPSRGVEPEADEQGNGTAPPPTDTARRVRESIQFSRGDSLRSSLAELDVELVEQLLGELEATQREIKDIKTRYNAFRRASRTAFEGFSMAREEYDKEVAARREVERQMYALRTKFAEQARRLAEVDQDQQTAEDLKRQSTSLRTSVIGMEKHLSQLKAEVALSTAEAAELAALELVDRSEDGVPDRQSVASSSPADVVEALHTRLEAVKDEHRAEIGFLVAERDDLLREIEELRKIRDARSQEIADLAQRNADLARQYEAPARDHDSLSGPSARLGSAAARSPYGGHVPSASTSSFMTATSVPGGRSAAVTALPLRAAGSLHGDGEGTYRPLVAEPSSRNKFWGKSKAKPDPSKQGHPTQYIASSTSAERSPGMSARGGGPAGAGGGAPEASTRQHNFQQTSILRPVRCDYCGDKMWGLNEVRCHGCGGYAHAKCAAYLSAPCAAAGGAAAAAPSTEELSAAVPTGPSMFGAELIRQAEKEGSLVPTVVVRCVEAVEAGGMLYEGIYRKTGGMGQTKLITQLFDRGSDFDLGDRDKFNDIAAVTSCLKNYFRSLPIPLMTHDLHEDFVAAAELPEGEARFEAIERQLSRLPPVHYATACYLFLHLNRVKGFAAENKMTAANLGVVFGPTVLRSPIAAREWSDMGPKTKLVEILCDHAERLFVKQAPGS